MEFTLSKNTLYEFLKSFKHDNIYKNVLTDEHKCLISASLILLKLSYRI